MSHPERPRITLGRGPQACQRALLEAVARQLSDLGPRALQNPVHLLVPSHSLRDHLLQQWIRTESGAAGLGCYTLRGLAHEVLERCGESPAPGAWMVPVLIRRAARQQASLRSCLEHLHNGYVGLINPVTDLLEAGLDSAHADAIDEVLTEEGRLTASVSEVQRSRSLVQVAIQVQDEMTELGLGHTSALLQRATELLRTRPDLHLPCSGWHVYGFADATGVATDLIEVLLTRYGGTAYLDHPPDPTDPAIEDPSFEFSRRFATRLADLGKPDLGPIISTDPADIQLVAALGGQAEVREAGWRIRRLLDNGSLAEGIGIVARQLDPYRSSLRTHLGRLGIPFSAIQTTGPLLPKGRRIRALLEVLTRRQRIRLERWLDARTPGSSDVPDFDLRLAMFGLGLGHLDELAQLQSEEVFGQETLPLPVRLGYSTGDDDGDLRLDRRRLPTDSLRQARDQAFKLCRLFEDWSDTRAWSAHLEHLDRLFALLGWSTSDPEETHVLQALHRLSRGVPPTMELDLEEFTQVLTVALRDLGTDRLGGMGGGVQILNVTEARGRTFDHLFVLGLNKGNFPRTVREDPTFPDTLRQVLGRQGHGVLPDLPQKRAGFAEERFLFAQLCAAAPNVTLSWQVADDDNRELTTSPLVERLLWNRQPTRVSAPTTLQPGPDPQRQPSTAYESAIRAALRGSHQQIKAAFSRAQQADLSVSPKDLTQARLGIAAELNRPSGPGSRLGPYFGFVGKAEDRSDPRRAQRLYVTTLERLAVCPWQGFLERLLRLEALPDPVEILPGLDPFLIGQLLHRILEELISSHLPTIPANLEEARRAKTVAVQWPQREILLRIARREAGEVAYANGIPWPGFAGVLAEVVLPYLDQARELLWQDPQCNQPVAVELEGSLPAGKGSVEQELHFRVDRIDSASGPLNLSDYKTNRRGVSSAQTQATRDRHLIAEIGKGRLLQAAAYALAAGGEDDQGRYVFVNPSFKGPDEARFVSVAATNTAAIESFEKAVGTLINAWHAGIFFPRLVEPDVDREPSACEYCSVAEACVRGDSGMRGRLRDWSASAQPTNPIDRTFLDAWYLASAKEPPS